MCFNQTTSLITFLISLVCFVYLLHYGISHKNKYDIFAAILTILIGSMQLIEFFLWGSQTCSQTNHRFSLLIMVVLFLQVVLGSVIFMYLFASKTEQWFSNFICLCIGFYTLFTIYLLYWLNKQRLCSRPISGSCRLVWAPFQILVNDSYGRILFLIFFSLYFFLGSYAFGGYQWLTGKMFEGHYKYPLRYSLLSYTFIVAALYAFLTNGKNLVDIFGTSWCFIAVAFGLVSALHW